MRSAVPAFRLPEEVLDRQIEFYRNMGIASVTGVRVGVDVTVEELRQEGYQAFVAATGAARSMGLSVPGADAQGIISAMDFLTRSQVGRDQIGISGAVAVIGGGSVALRCGADCLRLGADTVSVVCLERLEPGLKDSMLALTEEIEDASPKGSSSIPPGGSSRSWWGTVG